MEDKKIENEDNKKDWEKSLGIDLLVSPISAATGYIVGRICAWYNPLAIQQEIKNIRKTGIKSIADYLGHISAATGYFHRVYNIISNITENPSEIKSYIPVATNCAALVGIGAKKLYDRGKKQGKLEAKLDTI